MIGKVLVEENQPVKAGYLLAAIDDRDFIVAVDAAKAQVAAAQASVEGLAARVAQQETPIPHAPATVAAPDAAPQSAEANPTRYPNPPPARPAPTPAPPPPAPPAPPTPHPHPPPPTPPP